MRARTVSSGISGREEHEQRTEPVTLYMQGIDANIFIKSAARHPGGHANRPYGGVRDLTGVDLLGRPSLISPPTRGFYNPGAQRKKSMPIADRKRNDSCHISSGENTCRLQPASTHRRRARGADLTAGVGRGLGSAACMVFSRSSRVAPTLEISTSTRNGMTLMVLCTGWALKPASRNAFRMVLLEAVPMLYSHRFGFWESG